MPLYFTTGLHSTNQKFDFRRRKFLPFKKALSFCYFKGHGFAENSDKSGFNLSNLFRFGELVPIEDLLGDLKEEAKENIADC